MNQIKFLGSNYIWSRLYPAFLNKKLKYDEINVKYAEYAKQKVVFFIDERNNLLISKLKCPYFTEDIILLQNNNLASVVYKIENEGFCYKFSSDNFMSENHIWNHDTNPYRARCIVADFRINEIIQKMK